MRVALVHHWLINMRGGEKVLESLSNIYPHSDLFTLFYRSEGISQKLNKHRIIASALNNLPLSHSVYPNLLPLFPLACRTLDLRGYDLVISSDSSIIKGIRVPHGIPHICYCHSPPRYLWEMEDVYLKNTSFVKRMAAKAFFPGLRRWDYRAAQKVSFFVANSDFVKGRIQRYYERDSLVIYPPVSNEPPPKDVEPGEHYLFLSQLVPYKRPDLAVETFTKTGRKLMVVGDGPELKRLKKMAGPTIKFMGWQDHNAVRRYLASCRALIFPGEEDFGIVPVEAQMMGRPVIAFGRGGSLETVNNGETGLFFHNQDVDSLINALNEFERIEHRFSSDRIRKHALQFDPGHFEDRFRKVVKEVMDSRNQQ